MAHRLAMENKNISNEVVVEYMRTRGSEMIDVKTKTVKCVRCGELMRNQHLISMVRSISIVE